MEQLAQLIFISFPEALFFLFFTFALVGIDWKTTWKQGLFLSFVYSIATFFTYHLLTYDYTIRILINSIAFLVVLKILFQFTIPKCILITITYVISQIIGESIAVFSYVQLTHQEIHQIGQTAEFFLYPWACYLFVFILTLYIDKRQITIPNVFKIYQRYNLTVLLWTWVAILLVISINSIVMFYAFTFPTQQYVGISITIVFGLPLLSAILASYMVFRISQNMATLTMKQTEEVYLEYMDELITHFRSQRHDFLNHMQVVYGFAKIGNMDGILRYLEELNLEADETLSLLQLKHPPMAALLRAKAATATVKQVQFNVNVETSLDKLSIRPFELVKVIGNIIDNAFDEEIKAPEQKRYVEVSIQEEHPSYISIHVINRNSYIPPEKQPLIFCQGYTSKQDHHSGTGLAISKQIVQRYSGKITISSNSEQGTCFTVTLPANARGYK